MSNILEQFAILKPDLLIDELAVGPDFYQQLDTNYNGFKDHVLVSMHQFSSDWGVWERHPAGDELVILVAGSGKLVLRDGKQNTEVALAQAGDYCKVPANTWHTALIEKSATMLFITAGEGTQNEESPAF